MWQFVERFHVPTEKQNFMDALREQYEGGFKMSAYKDKTQGTWYVSFRYIDWTGKKTQKLVMKSVSLIRKKPCWHHRSRMP